METCFNLGWNKPISVPRQDKGAESRTEKRWRSKVMRYRSLTIQICKGRLVRIFQRWWLSDESLWYDNTGDTVLHECYLGRRMRKFWRGDEPSVAPARSFPEFVPQRDTLSLTVAIHERFPNRPYPTPLLPHHPSNTAMASPVEFTKQQRFELAIRDYQKSEAEGGQVSVRKLARQYGLAKSTLSCRIRGRQSKQLSAESRQLLRPEQEEALAKWIKKMEAWGWPPRVTQVKYMATELLNGNHPQRSPVEIGVNWVQKFLARRTELAYIFSRATHKERMAVHNEERLARWFGLYKETVENYKIEQQDIYNMDEKGFAMGAQGNTKVMCSKNHKSLLTSDGNREWASLIECVNILGDVLKIWITFRAKYLQKKWMEALGDGHIIIRENGSTNHEIDHSWLETCFEPETRRRQRGEYRLLIIDGHQSHLASKSIDFAERYKIIILSLPSHSTDVLQPLDVGIFGPLAQAYRNELDTLTRLGIGYAIDKVDFIKMYQKARNSVMTPGLIQSAWTNSGLLPWNPEVALGNLPTRKSRPRTPPEITFTSSGRGDPALPYTPYNSAEIDRSSRSHAW